jgi:hypothetical protein
VKAGSWAVNGLRPKPPFNLTASDIIQMKPSEGDLGVSFFPTVYLLTYSRIRRKELECPLVHDICVAHFSRSMQCRMTTSYIQSNFHIHSLRLERITDM